MLRKNASMAARPVIANLVRRGIALESLDGSPLDDLVTASAPDVEIISQVEPAEGVDVTDVILGAVEETSVVSTSHDAIVNGLVDQGAAQMLKTIEKARTVVVPAIATTVDAVVERVDRALTPPNDLRIFKIHPLAAATTISDLFAQYKDAATDLSFIPDLPTLTSEQISALLETGSADTNAQIVDFLAGFPDGYIDELINDLIRGSLSHSESVSNGYARLVQHSGATPYVRRSTASLAPLALACVILNNLSDNPPEGVPVSIDYWNEQISTVQAGLGATYHMLLVDIANHIASGRLSLPTTLRQGDVVGLNEFPILDRVYDAFLERDGYPELLFATTMGYNDDTIDNVLRDAEALNAAWTSECEKFRNNALENLSTTARGVVYSQLGSLIGELDLTELGVPPEQLWDAIREYAEVIPFTPDSLYENVRYLIAEVIYARYQTYPLIVATDAYMADNPNCNPRVAAYHGAKAYICGWVCDQLKRQ